MTISLKKINFVPRGFQHMVKCNKASYKSRLVSLTMPSLYIRRDNRLHQEPCQRLRKLEVEPRYERSICCIAGCSEITLNGPQGMVYAATVRFQLFLFDATNLLSCMALDVEHLYDTQPHQTSTAFKEGVLQRLGQHYKKESIKRLSSSKCF